MDEYIKKKDAIEYFMTNTNWYDEDGYAIDDSEVKRKLLMDYFNSIPTADVVEVVKCEDCRHNEYCSQCISMFGTQKDLYYCEYGER